MPTSSRRPAPFVLGLLLATGGACAPEPAGEPATRPDVVLIVVDTLRADRLSCYGYPRPTSPLLDELAADGALFSDVTCQSPWTLPSMVSILTGRYQHGTRTSVHDDEPVLAELFQRAGYRTVAVLGNPILSGEICHLQRGFDVYERLEADPVKKIMRGSVDSDALTDRLAEAFAAHGLADDDAPLFLWLQPYDPHGPYLRWKPLDGDLPLEGTLATRPADFWGSELGASGPAAPASDPDWADALATMAAKRGRYDQEVLFNDLVLARTLAILEERGRTEETVFALASDHGEGLWEHRAHLDPEGDDSDATAASEPEGFFYRKHGAQLYEEAIATPLVLWGAGVPRGVVVEEPVENVDLVPTLLELADLPVVPGLDGRSLLPLASGIPREEPRAFLYSNASSGGTVREVATGLKLIAPRGEGVGVQPIELYDLGADPFERADLAGERPADVERLSAVLEAWFTEHALAPDGVVDPKHLRQLRRLGYTADDIGQ